MSYLLVFCSSLSLQKVISAQLCTIICSNFPRKAWLVWSRFSKIKIKNKNQHAIQPTERWRESAVQHGIIWKWKAKVSGLSQLTEEIHAHFICISNLHSASRNGPSHSRPNESAGPKTKMSLSKRARFLIALNVGDVWISHWHPRPQNYILKKT